MKKFGTRLLAVVVASSMIAMPVMAAPSVDDLKEDKAAKESEVKSLQDELNSIMTKLSDLEEDLISKGEEISQAEKDLEAAEEKEQEQYEAMKKRIKFMYEEGNSTALETLVTSEDFSDLVNKAEYVQNVHTYDRNQLQEYVETKQEIADLKTTLEEDQQKMESMQVEYEEQEEELNTVIASKQAEVSDLDARIQEAAEAAAAREAEAQRQAQLQAQQAANNTNTGNTNTGNTNTGNTNNGSSNSGSSNVPPSVNGGTVVSRA